MRQLMSDSYPLPLFHVILDSSTDFIVDSSIDFIVDLSTVIIVDSSTVIMADSSTVIIVDSSTHVPCNLSPFKGAYVAMHGCWFPVAF